MKRLCLFIVLLTISMNLLAQSDVTRFLGIPVDGSKKEMIRSLKAKGFVLLPGYDGVMEGEFNGTHVHVIIMTTRNKVSRIVVSESNTMNASDIKSRFNRLCSQFKNNPNYTFDKDYTIPDDEDIEEEMRVNDKQYVALFYQKDEPMDSPAVVHDISNILLAKFSKKDLKHPTDEVKQEILATEVLYNMNRVGKKPVWFMITGFGERYYIMMYYDNGYNRAHGEDL